MTNEELIYENRKLKDTLNEALELLSLAEEQAEAGVIEKNIAPINRNDFRAGFFSGRIIGLIALIEDTLK